MLSDKPRIVNSRHMSNMNMAPPKKYPYCLGGSTMFTKEKRKEKKNLHFIPQNPMFLSKITKSPTDPTGSVPRWVGYGKHCTVAINSLKT